MEKDLSEAAREAQREYHRKYRETHKEAIKANRQRYWERIAARKQEAAHEQTEKER